MDVFRLERPTSGERPVLVEVPHAGLGIPPLVADEIVTTHQAAMRDADLFVDRLYADAPSRGAVLLAASLSRFVVDLNRAPDDLEPSDSPESTRGRLAQPRGVVWRVATDGHPLWTRPLTADQVARRIAAYHAPYHAALRGEIDRLRATHGTVRVVAAHSMPSTARPFAKDPGPRRADVVPGTRGRTSADARIIDLVDAHFREAGLSVRHDEPYKGGYTTQHYGRPRDGVHVVQIELNRALYMDEVTCHPIEPSFGSLRALLAGLVQRLGEL